ncbi:hypothetical protein PG990_000334 [Apiospora arundinis]
MISEASVLASVRGQSNRPNPLVLHCPIWPGCCQAKQADQGGKRALHFRHGPSLLKGFRFRFLATTIVRILDRSTTRSHSFPFHRKFLSPSSTPHVFIVATQGHIYTYKPVHTTHHFCAPLPVAHPVTMADYNTFKVPELKKLLQEKSLPVAGNKADLVARLQKHDEENAPAKPAAAAAAPAATTASTAEDEIDWDDEEPAPAPAAAIPPPTAEAPKEASVPAPVTEAPAAAVEEEKKEEKAAPAEENATGEAAATTEATEEKKPEEPKPDFSAHLPASAADEEAKKRAERAKRFGIVEETPEEEKKKAERAKRFGAAADDTAAVVKGLDEALPERRPKRGREGGADAERGQNKRSNNDSRRGGGGRRDDGGRPRGGRGGRDGGRDGGRRGGNDRDRKPNAGGISKPSRVLDNPEEKRKAEERAKRFASNN